MDNKKDLKIILDSTSGYAKTELEKDDFAFLPQQVIIDDESLRDGDNVNLEKTIELMANAQKVLTSQPSYGEVYESIKNYSDEYKYVIFVPMNKTISSTYDVALKISEQFDNVAVIANRLFGTAMIDAAKKAKEAFYKDYKIQDAISAIHYVNENSQCYIAPKNLDAFIRGGRLKGAKRFILEKTHLIPRLLIEDEGIKVKGVKRNFGKLLISIIEKIIQKIGGENKIDDYNWEIIHTYDQQTIKIAEKALKQYHIKNFLLTPAASIVGIHTGIGAIAINTWPKSN